MSQKTLTSPISVLPARTEPLSSVLPLFRANIPLTILTFVSLALVGLAAVGLLVDPRVITGMPAWVKPMKFGISVAIYSLTFVWLLTFVRGHSRLVGLISTVTAVALIVELAIVALQVVRGVPSHFNISTSFDGLLWQIMGASILPIWIMGLLLAVLLMFQRFTDSTFAWSLRLGVLVSLVGMFVAFAMTKPTPQQQAQGLAGEFRPSIGAHSVGVEDGGPGLPFVGWSTEGGDLRVAHFVGLHALQVLPLAGYLINRMGKRSSNKHRTALVWVAGLGYLGLVFLLFWQALRGQSVIAPDALTLLAFVGLVAATGSLSALIVAQARARA